MFQTKQFVRTVSISNTGTAGFFGADAILLGADTVLGISNTVQGALKRVVVVGIEYYFDAVIESFNDQFQLILFNYEGIYKDTLDPSSVPDASGTLFLNADQVDGTVNQQLFPERILDRRSFTLAWSSAVDEFSTAGQINPGMSAARIVRRRVSMNAREALVCRVEAFMPNGTVTPSVLEAQWYGVITYRVDM